MLLKDDVPVADDPRYQPQVYRSRTALAVVAPTWRVSTKFAFDPDYLEAYKRNPTVALRDYGSVASYSIEGYLRDPGLLDLRVNLDRESPLTEEGRFKDWFIPKGNHHYFIHMDMSARRDATGFAMGHWDKNAEKLLQGSGVTRGMAVVDLMVQIKALPGKDIDFDSLRQMIYTLRDRGFYIRKVTMDQFQSVDMMQALMKRGFDVELYSVDRNTEAYDTMLELMLQGMIDFYLYPPFMDEVRRLIVKDGKKVDHPPKGSKDVSDAVAAVITHSRISSAFEPAATSQTVSREKAFEAAETHEGLEKRARILGFKDETSTTYI